jgi:hypothetical protein
MPSRNAPSLTAGMSRQKWTEKTPKAKVGAKDGSIQAIRKLAAGKQENGGSDPNKNYRG